MSSLVTLISCLPQILGLIQSIEKALKDQQTNATVKDKLTQVQGAFDAKDSSKLNDLFNQ